METEFQFYKVKCALEVVGDDGCTTVGMSLMPVGCTLNDG